MPGIVWDRKKKDLHVNLSFVPDLDNYEPKKGKEGEMDDLACIMWMGGGISWKTAQSLSGEQAEKIVKARMDKTREVEAGNDPMGWIKRWHLMPHAPRDRVIDEQNGQADQRRSSKGDTTYIKAANLKVAKSDAGTGKAASINATVSRATQTDKVADSSRASVARSVSSSKSGQSTATAGSKGTNAAKCSIRPSDSASNIAAWVSKVASETNVSSDKSAKINVASVANSKVDSGVSVPIAKVVSKASVSSVKPSSVKSASVKSTRA